MFWIQGFGVPGLYISPGVKNGVYVQVRALGFRVWGILEALGFWGVKQGARHGSKLEPVA